MALGLIVGNVIITLQLPYGWASFPVVGHGNGEISHFLKCMMVLKKAYRLIERALDTWWWLLWWRTNVDWMPFCTHPCTNLTLECMLCFTNPSTVISCYRYKYYRCHKGYYSFLELKDLICELWERKRWEMARQRISPYFRRRAAMWRLPLTGKHPALSWSMQEIWIFGVEWGVFQEECTQPSPYEASALFSIKYLYG